MMAEEFEIARQATLEEVKQTGIETQQTVNETKTTIGDIGDPAGEESLVGLVKNIPKTVPTGAIKSVQRGTGTSPEGSFDEIKTINIQINTVNPEKCFVIIHTALTNDRDNSFGMGCYVKKLTSTQLTLGVVHRIEYSWQVIECF